MKLKPITIRPLQRRRLLLLLMRTYLYLLCSTVFALNVENSTAQESVKIDIDKEVTVDEVFDIIKNQTNYHFIYPDDLFDSAPKVKLKKGTITVDKLLKDSMPSANFSILYSNNKQIIIKPRSSKQQRIITGTITDQNNHPMSGVTIIVKGEYKAISTFSNEEGKYSIVVKNAENVLTFSFLGYQTIDKFTGDSDVIDIIMKEDILELGEAVVIGYGSSTKRDLTGTVSSIKSSAITNQPVGNALQAMSGKMAGVRVTQENGLPGSSFNVQIRGQNSLQSGVQPLYIIDGIPFTNDAINRFGSSAANGSLSPLSSINPSDIDRIDVLKDADATAIYGARGANGVVLITTKRGKTGKATLDINAYKGSGKVSSFAPMLNTAQYIELRREAFANDGEIPDAFTAPDLFLYDQNAYTNFQKLLLGGSAEVTNIQGTFSGGNEVMHFLVSGNYRKEGTVFPGESGSRRITSRINLDYKSPDKRFSAIISGAYSNDKTNLPSVDVSTAYSLPPNYPLYNPDGSLFWDDYQMNPLAQLNQKYKGVTNVLMGNLMLDYTPVDNLAFKMRVGYNETNLDQKAAYPASSLPPYFLTSYAQFSNSKTTNFILEPTVDYSFKRDKWSLVALLGTSWQTNDFSGYSIQGDNYSSDALLNSIMGAGRLTPIYQEVSEYNFNSVFGRLTYNYEHKYIVNVNYRRDGSSKFGANNRFGNFGSVGASWLFSEESFLKENSSFLSLGKLRASYGLTGNDQISNYLYLPLYESGNSYDNSATLKVVGFENPNIKWETTKKLEFGLDLEFFKNKVSFTTNYYRNRSSNQIVLKQLATQSGFSLYQDNIDALVQNTGVEFELSSKNIVKADFTWNTSFNLTLPQSKLISYPGLSPTNTVYAIGKPIPYVSYYDYKEVDPETGAPTYNVDEDGNIKRIAARIGTPFYGGLSNTLTYKNWSLDFLFQFTHEKGFTNKVSQYNNEFVLGNMVNQPKAALDRWRQQGDMGTNYPAATTTSGTEVYTAYDYYDSSSASYGDISYLRLQSANLSYGIPKTYLDKLNMNSCSIYMQGQNLINMEKSKYRLAGTMPLLRTLVLGINCSF